MDNAIVGSLVHITEEPDLGPWRVHGPGAHGTVRLVSLWQDVVRELLPAYGAFSSHPLLPGSRVSVGRHNANPRGGTIRSMVDGTGGLRVALVQFDDGPELEVDEAQLHPLPPNAADPLEVLSSLSWRGPWRFFCRWRMQQLLGQWHEASEGIPGLLGARIRALGHQIYASRRVLWDRAPRYILADEVGLGKTIEAGLVIQALTAQRPALRVLVIAPGSMTRQWLCELYLKFGARPFVLIESAPGTAERKQNMDRVVAETKVIVSTTALAEDGRLADLIKEQPWDLVVVDEAHQFPPDHVLYPLLRSLSLTSDGFLALSATPSKSELRGLVGLLALIAPDVYSPNDESALLERVAQKREVWDALSYTHQLMSAPDAEFSAEMLSEYAGEWRRAVVRDPVVDELTDRLDEGDKEALNELVAYVQEHHRLDHRLIRTRRFTLGALGEAWSPRTGEVIEYERTTAEALLLERIGAPPAELVSSMVGRALQALYLRFACTTPELLNEVLEKRLRALDASPSERSAENLVASLQSDPGPAEEEHIVRMLLATPPIAEGEARWLKMALALASEWATEPDAPARFRTAVAWLDGFLADDASHKVLVFSQEKAVVVAFAAQLRKVRRRQRQVAEFHVGMELSEQSDAALKFQKEPLCRVLVSDELGGEGRNFQVANVVLHLDVPWSVARIEQRIGRLDRLGRDDDNPVRSVVMVGPLEIERLLFRLHHDVFGVYTRSVGGLEFVLPRMQRAIFEALGGGAEALDLLSATLTSEVETAMTEANDDFELALDTSRPELERTRDLAEILEETSNDDGDDWYKALAGWSKVLGVKMYSMANDVVGIHWSPEDLDTPLAGFEGTGEHRFQGTFDRQQALADEHLQYFAPGHRVIDAMVSALGESHQGRATVFLRMLGKRHQGDIFLIVIIHCGLDASKLVGHDISAGLLARVRSRLWPEVQAVAVQLHPGKVQHVRPIDDPALKDAVLSTDYKGKANEPKVTADLLAKLSPPSQVWAAARDGIAMALEEIRAERRSLTQEAAEDLHTDLGQHVGFLRWKLSREQSTVARQSIQAEIDGIAALLEAVRGEALQVDAAAVVIGG